MKNTKFKTRNLKSRSFAIKGSAEGFRHNFYRIRDYINNTCAMHGNFPLKNGVTLFRPLTVNEMRKKGVPEDELPVCNVSVRQKGSDVVAVFTAPAKAIDLFSRNGKDILSEIESLWVSFNRGWAHETSLVSLDEPVEAL